MIKTGEKIHVEATGVTKEQLEQIKALSHVYQVEYQNDRLDIKCNGGKHNLVQVLDLLQKQEINFGRVYSELPTLNDVFLEITGTELRDSVEG